MARSVACGLIAGCATILAAIAGAAPASAANPGPRWAIESVALPTSFSQAATPRCEAAEVCDSYLVTATNVGTMPSAGTITIRDKLPEGIAFKARITEELEVGEHMECLELTPQLRCTYSHPVPPGGVLAITIKVDVTVAATTSVTNHAEVEEGEGAGATETATSEPSTVPNTINGETPSFGIQGFAASVYGSAGASDEQADDHPGALSTTIDYTTELDPKISEANLDFHAVQEPKTEIVDLPLGFAGNPLAAEQCSESNLYGSHFGKPCPAGSRVGTATIDRAGGAIRAKIYNIVPEAGYPAMFGFEVDEEIILMRSRVLPSTLGYVLSVSVPDVPRSTALKITGATLTFFGDPAEQDGGAGFSQALFTNPSDCGAGPLKARVEMDSWVNPQRWVSKETTMYEASPTQGVRGCNLLEFNPTIELKPETTQADTPSGYAFDLKVPQAPNLPPTLATPDLKNAELTLPEGVSLSPSAADGLVGCKESGPEGIELGNHDTLGHEVQEGEELGPDELPHPAAGHCPAASQIGTVEVTTPLLSSPLQGHVYVAQPKCGGEGQPACTQASATNGELFGLYLEAAGSGVIIKLKGTVSADPATGRLTTRFDENPQFPFSELKLKLTGESRAPLANPQSCGEAETTSILTPWSAPESGSPATPVSSFPVTGCQSPMPFSPAFSAGTLSPAAGSFSPFTLTFSRHDGEQDLSGLIVQTPPGLLGMLSTAQLCPEPQASNGTCGPESLIGHTQVAAGAGSHPFWVGGNLFLTGPYKGAPFGLSVVVPAIAGPFNLGNVIVRAAIFVDPHDSHLTVISDPLPQIIDGVPPRVQTVNVSIDKPNFMFNPTNCSQQQIMGTVTAAQGASANVASPFAAAACKNLLFKPGFTVSTSAKTSKANGASLYVKVTQKPGEANIHKVDLQLPLALPSRLTTLQKACSEAQFATNPAGCPAGSVIGTATAHTPTLQVPLTGPAYLVSHGAAAFPDVVFLLQGDERGGVIRIDVIGNTDIKKGITYSRFETVPDTPISSFETNLPEGPHSALAANGNLCTQNLVMPTTIVGQNGAQVTQSTKIAVTGCKAVTISKRKLSGRRVVLGFFLTAKGTVTVTGKGLKRYRKTLSAGSHQIKVALSKAGLSMRRHHRKINIKVALRSGPKASSATTTLKL